jgi:thioredoxin reductase
LVNYGIGYSITTHAHLLAGKTAAVIGTSGRALRGMLELATTGAHVYLIVPDTTDMRVSQVRRLGQIARVTVFEGYKVEEISGATSVEHIVIEQDGERSWLRVDAVFADLGLLPNSSLAPKMVRIDAEGFIWVDDKHMTTLPGLFAAGDVTTVFAENILVAIGDGTRAAINAYDYLLAHTPLVEAETADQDCLSPAVTI